MRSILDVIPTKLHGQLGPCFGDRINKGVLVTMTKTTTRAVRDAGEILNIRKDGEYVYFLIIPAYMVDEFPEYEWEHVSYGWEVEDAKVAAAKKSKSPYSDLGGVHHDTFSWKGN